MSDIEDDFNSSSIVNPQLTTVEKRLEVICPELDEFINAIREGLDGAFEDEFVDLIVTPFEVLKK